MGHCSSLKRKKMISLRQLILLLPLLGQNPAWAQQDALGRLFFTPQQRSELDRQRLLNPGGNSAMTDNEVSQTINGEVRRSNGRSTRWINGSADWDSNTPRPRVPVGDTFHPGTGEHQSVLGGGKIIVNHNSR
jgi:hypothetical protein